MIIYSIIVTNYNYGQFIDRCLRSCLNQSLNKEHYEIIVVDDKSTDNSVKRLQDYKDGYPNLKIIYNKKNLGVAASANRGIKLSKGKYFVRVDADDFISSEFLVILGQYINNDKSILGVACDYYLLDHKKKKTKVFSSEIFPISCGILYDKNKLSKYGYYNPKFRHREEEELRARIGVKYKIHHLNFPLYRYQMHSKNKTLQSNYKDKFNKLIHEIKFRDNKKIFKKYQNLKKEIIAIIPARSGSKRLKNKNLFKIWGKPMIYWPISELKKSSYVKDIYVTSDSKKILDYVKGLGVRTVKRPLNISDDITPKMKAINHAVKKILNSNKNKITIIISIQANSPEITKSQIDKCIEHLIYNDFSEVVSVDKNLSQNGAIRVMKYPYNFQETLSTNFGCVVTDILDIHTIKDINKLKINKNEV